MADTTPVAMYDMTPRQAAMEAIAFEVVLIRTLYEPPFMGRAVITYFSE